MPAAFNADSRIHLLADHLDAILAAGEDLSAVAPAPAVLDAPKGRRGLGMLLAERRRFVEQARVLELALVARVLKAREYATVVRRADPRLRMIAELFLASTHVLADAAAALGDPAERGFDGGRDGIAYLRSRGLIAADAAGIAEAEPLAMREELRVAGVVTLSVLLDLAASFLDALDVAFDLYAGGEAGEEESSGTDRGASSAAA